MDGRSGGSGGGFGKGAGVVERDGNGNKIGENSGGVKLAHTS